MRKIQKTVEVFDCGQEGCTHLTEHQANLCVERLHVFNKSELLRLKVFRRYISTRESVVTIGNKFGISKDTVTCWSNKCLASFLGGRLSNDDIIDYGKNTGLVYAVNNRTDFWKKVIDTRIKQLSKK